MATSCLDIMHEVLTKFGHLLTTEQGPLKTILLHELSSSKAGIRKRAMGCLGAITKCLCSRCCGLPQYSFAAIAHVWDAVGSLNLRCTAGALVPYVPNPLLDEIAEELLARMKACSGQPDATRTVVQALGTVG